MHSLQPAVLVELPAVEGVLGSEPELAPSNLAVVELTPRARILAVGTTADFVDLLEVAPAVLKERQRLGYRVLPRHAHVEHARLQELGRVDGALLVGGGLDSPLNLAHQSLDDVEHCADGRAIVGHLPVGLDPVRALEPWQELLIDGSTELLEPAEALDSEINFLRGFLRHVRFSRDFRGHPPSAARSPQCGTHS